MDPIRNSFFAQAEAYQQVGENRCLSHASTPKQFVRYLVPVASGCFLLACAQEHGRETQVSRDTTTLLRVSASSSPATAVTTPVTGPRIVVDSGARGAKLELSAGAYVLRVPAEMARVLFDTLPGFRPLPRTAYPEAIRRWVDSNDPAASPLSVVVGDFDQDSVPDFAMVGSAKDTGAVVLLLSNARVGGKPRLIFIGRPWSVKIGDAEDLYLSPRHPSKLSNDFVLHADAVSVEIFEKTSSVYYIENGQLREFATSED
jgi:hypothetical protein